jgi:hypothetical protein
MTTEKEIYVDNETVAYNDGYEEGIKQGRKQLAEECLMIIEGYGYHLKLKDKLQKEVERE